MKPTNSELKILQVLWDRGPSTVRAVHDKIAEDKEAGYTTTLKLMQIMVEKGLASRDTSSRTHIYIAQVEEDSVKGNLLKSFISSTFKGSASTLVMKALGNGETTQKELEEIKALISKIEKDK